jgi:hypothetical protein
MAAKLSEMGFIGTFRTPEAPTKEPESLQAQPEAVAVEAAPPVPAKRNFKTMRPSGAEALALLKSKVGNSGTMKMSPSAAMNDEVVFRRASNEPDPTINRRVSAHEQLVASKPQPSIPDTINRRVSNQEPKPAVTKAPEDDGRPSSLKRMYQRRLSVPVLDPLLTKFGAPSNDNSAHRLSVYQEILDTEHSYIFDLRVILSVFKAPLEQAILSGNSIISQDDINLLFGNIEDILNVNSELLIKLEKDRSVVHLSALIPTAFIFMEKKFDSYIPYCNAYSNMMERIQELMANNYKFKTFIDNCKTLEDCRNLDVVSFIIKPVQRICKYPLFFNDLMKVTNMFLLIFVNLFLLFRAS